MNESQVILQALIAYPSSLTQWRVPYSTYYLLRGKMLSGSVFWEFMDGDVAAYRDKASGIHVHS